MRVLHVQQRTCHIHQHRIVNGTRPLGQRLQGQHLVDDHPPWLLKAQHGEGIGDMPQGRQQSVKLFTVLTVAPHELVKPLLDAHQVVAQRGHYRTQGIPARPGLQLFTPIAQRQIEVGQVIGTGEAVRRAADQAGLGQRLDPPAGAQLVEQRQHHQWQVMARATQAFKVRRQLLEAAEQCAQAIPARADLAIGQGLGEQLQLFGQACCAAQFEHTQATMHLVQVVDHEGQHRQIARLAGKALQRLAGLAQAIEDGGLGPGQRHGIVALGA